MTKITTNNNDKKLAAIVKAYDKMENAKRGYVLAVIELGERLIEAKGKQPHGKWESYCREKLKSVLGGRISSPEQALKYMQIAQNKALVLEFFKGEKTINSITQAIREATPEMLAQAESHRLAQEQEAEQKRLDRERLERERMEAKAKAESKEPIDGEFTEVVDKPAEKPKQFTPDKAEAIIKENELLKQEAARGDEVINELDAVNNDLKKEIDSLVKIFESNDQVTTAVKEAQKARDIQNALQDRINGLINENAELKKLCAYWKRKFERLEARHAST